MEDPKMNVSMAGLLTPQELVNFLMDNFNDELQTNQALFREKNVFGKLKWRLEQVIPLVEGGCLLLLSFARFARELDAGTSGEGAEPTTATLAGRRGRRRIL